MIRIATKKENEYYSKKLYPVQDEIFKLIPSDKFYLTGGTCLSRFYYNHRYSDDLDFFFDGKKYSKGTFEKECDQIRNIISGKFKIINVLDDEYFKRIIVVRENVELKIEFIFEPVTTIGKKKSFHNILLDTKENIVANKLTTIYNRKTNKDYIDLYYLLKEFELEKVQKWADRKMVPIDYEGTLLCLLDGTFYGDVIMIDKIDLADYELFVKNTIDELINNARKI